MSVETAAGERTGRASLALAGVGLGYLLLTGLNAKATAVLGGTLNFFGVKEIVLNGLLVAGFVYACFRVRGGRSRWFAAVLCGVAIWRATAVLFDVVTALANGSLTYWSLPQLAVTAVLVGCGVVALLAVIWVQD